MAAGFLVVFVGAAGVVVVVASCCDMAFCFGGLTDNDASIAGRNHQFINKKRLQSKMPAVATIHQTLRNRLLPTHTATTKHIQAKMRSQRRSCFIAATTVRSVPTPSAKGTHSKLLSHQGIWFDAFVIGSESPSTGSSSTTHTSI